MIMKPFFASCVAVVAFASSASAGPQVTLGRAGLSMVLVWKDGASMDEGMSLIQAGVLKTKPELFDPLLSCVVQTGTKAIITDVGFATHTIMVIDGPSAGCKGDVVMEDVKTN